MVAVHWFRRDLRIEDNMALAHALAGDLPVLPVFIFDDHILEGLPADDARVGFIHRQLMLIAEKLGKHSSGVMVRKGDPLETWKELIKAHDVRSVYFNLDYEPYALGRDKSVTEFLESKGIAVNTYNDHLLFAPGEVLKDDGLPYTVYTPYRNKWMKLFRDKGVQDISAQPANYARFHHPVPSLADIGFKPSAAKVPPPDYSAIPGYAANRDDPSIEGTSRLGPHLRFGTIGVRQLLKSLGPSDGVFLDELVWREFFAQIMWHYPGVINNNFRSKYDGIQWRNDESEFNLWCNGQTGYPLVDAGMRQLNASGFMHNRVRMVTASFLCKHLLIDWRWGEAYFALKLLDFELASNNGNWQWAAGTGCDAAPYFRVFNPYEQQKKFDPGMRYIRKWVPEFGSSAYPPPIVEHKFARERALSTYKQGIN